MKYIVSIPKIKSQIQEINLEYNDNGTISVETFLIPPNESKMELNIKEGFDYVYDSKRTNKVFNVIFNYNSTHKSGVVQLVPYLVS